MSVQALECVEIEPLDVVVVRGNRRFADSGHGGLRFPPPPTLFAGALRTRMLLDAGEDLARFAKDGCEDPELAKILGTPNEPGSFEIALVGLRRADRTYLPMPADMVVQDSRDGTPVVHVLEPAKVVRSGVCGSFVLPQAPVLRTAERTKVVGGWWIEVGALAAHLRGEEVQPEALVRSSALWSVERRVGIGMEPRRRTVRTGLLYSTDCASLTEGTRFVVAVRGAGGRLPKEGLLRLGGDAHVARVRACTDDPFAVLWSLPPLGKRFRLVLWTGGIAPDGWLLPGVRCQQTASGRVMHLKFDGFDARLVAAAVAGSEVVSGWDLAKRGPKPALRVIPAGSVFWFEHEGGPMTALQQLVEKGLWPLMSSGAKDEPYAPRRSEGFNNVGVGVG